MGSSDSKPLRVGINGLGRIGRLIVRHAFARAEDSGWPGATRTGPRIEVVAANDLASAEQLAYLLKHDTAHGRWAQTVGSEGGALTVGSKRIELYHCPSPDQIPWNGVDLVFECTGRFSRREQLDGHLQRGPFGVVLGQPGDVDQTIVVGVNDDDLVRDHRIVSAASCTTNAVAPVLAVLDATFGVRWALIGTVHANTGAQRVVDGAASDLRRGRAAAANIVPTTTGAARAVAQVIPGLAGKLDGQAVRVPVIDGSLYEITCTLGDGPTLDRVLDVLRAAKEDKANRGILDVRRAPLVSSDIIDDLHSSIVDEEACLGAGPLIRVVGWYDNEAAYAARMLDLAASWGSLKAEVDR